MPTKTKTTAPRRRTSTQAFPLTEIERMLLVLYHSVPIAVRADVGQRLFSAWTDPSPDDRHASALRYDAAKARFRVGSLSVNVLDDVYAGEPLDAETGGAQ